MNILLPELSVLLLIGIFSVANSQCSASCDALGSYYVWLGNNLSFISQITQVDTATILRYNPQIPNQDNVFAGTRINLPFPCGCIVSEFLGHVFLYNVIGGDTYETVSNRYYSNLTNLAWMERFNSYQQTQIPDTATLNVTVNCSCGDRSVSSDYGLFVTYPLRPEDSLESVATTHNFPSALLRRYNPTANFSGGSGVVFIPGRDPNGSYHPLGSSSGRSGGVVAGVVVAGVLGVLLFSGCIYIRIRRKKNREKILLLSRVSGELSLQDGFGPQDGNPADLSGITVEKSVEFSYEELANATDNFSIANKIGEGGFGSVYYAELRGEKAAIKKMDMQATKEFLAELKVLTNVHHLNLVRLIGYCIQDSLFLVYEFIENGNLGQHLQGSGRDPLTWAKRLHIALDSARGLEYIHEHTVPIYIHRDIKTENILIDKNFRAKVADFGLTKLTEVENNSFRTRGFGGTFGYMPPEAVYGDISPKLDVYAFGVVLYQLISAKDAVVKTNSSTVESKGLVALFEEAFSNPDPTEEIRKMVDPRLEDNYLLDSAIKLAQLAKLCTDGDPKQRPMMRSIVVALMTFSSSTEDWDAGTFYGNQGLLNLMSGR